MPYNNTNTQSTTPQVQPKSFNDALDVFSNQFTPVEKLHGLLSLPLNPVLHPLKTIKGTFEAYSKVASIPLAIYSGNVNKVPGIISGDEEFSGRDVLTQLQGNPPTGILGSLEGFGIDVASDPFVGVFKAPEEAAEVMSKSIHHMAAPGFAQIVQKFGVWEKLARLTGTGTGSGMDISAIHSPATIAAANPEQSIVQNIEDVKAQLLKESQQAQAKAMQESLAKDPATDPLQSTPISVTDELGNESKYIHNIYNFTNGQHRLVEHAIAKEGTELTADALKDLVTRQTAVDTAELNRISALQRERRYAKYQLDEISKIFDPQKYLESHSEEVQASETQQLIQALQAEIYKQGGYAKVSKTNSKLIREYNELLETGTNTTSDFPIDQFNDTYLKLKASDDSAIVNAMKQIKDTITVKRGSVNKVYSPINLRRNKYGKGSFTLRTQPLVSTEFGMVPMKDYRKNPAAFNTALSTNADRLEYGLNKLLEEYTPDERTIQEYTSNREYSSPEAKEAHIKELRDKMFNAKLGEDFLGTTEADKLRNSVIDDIQRQTINYTGQYDPDSLYEDIDGFYGEELFTEIAPLLEKFPLDLLVKIKDMGIADVIEQTDLSYQVKKITQVDPMKEAFKRGFVEQTDTPSVYRVLRTWTLPHTLKPEIPLLEIFSPSRMKQVVTQAASTDVVKKLVNEGHAHIAKQFQEFLHSAVNLEARKVQGKFQALNNMISDAYRSVDKKELLTDTITQGDISQGWSLSSKDSFSILDDILQPLKQANTDTGFWTTINATKTHIPNFMTKGYLPKSLHKLVSSQTFKAGDTISVMLDRADISEGGMIKPHGSINTPDWDMSGVDLFRGAKDAEPVKAEAVENTPIEPVADPLPAWIQEYTEHMSLSDTQSKIKQNLETIPAVKSDPKLVAESVQLEAYTQAVVKDETITKIASRMLNDNIQETHQAIEMQLGAEQLKRFMGIRQKNVTAFDYIKTDLKDTLSDITEYVEQKVINPKLAAKLRYRVTSKAVQKFYKDYTIKIDGKNLSRELIHRSHTLAVPSVQLHPILQEYATELNSQIGHDVFTFETLDDPNAHVGVLRADTLFLEKDDEAFEALEQWHKDNQAGTNGFRDIEINIQKEQKPFSDPILNRLVDNLHKSMIRANKEMLSRLNFANLNDQVTFTPETFFPHALKSFPKSKYDKSGKILKKVDISFDTMVDDSNIQLSGYFKHKFNQVGAFSSTTYGRSVLGTPFDFKIIIDGKQTQLFTSNPLSAYKHMYGSAFAAHENLRVAQEIMFHPQFALNNLKITDMPQDAIANFDIMIPVRNQTGGLINMKTHSPTKANLKRFKSKGYLVSKPISAEARSLMKYQILSSKAPAFSWMSKNIIGPFKRGVLLNLGFPIGNAGDMLYKTLATTPFNKWSDYHKNLASSYKILSSHEKIFRKYASLRQRGGMGRRLYETSFTHFCRDIIKYLESDSRYVPEWNKAEDGKQLIYLGTRGDKNQLNEHYNALMYEIYTSLPTATSNQRAIMLEEGKVLKDRRDEEFAKFLQSKTQNAFGRMMNKVTTDNPIAEKIGNFNENLENAFRFTQFATDTNLSKDTIRDVIKNPDQLFLANEMIKFNHMHFAEMTGDAVWASTIVPFWQFPVKNAVWWAKFIADKPQLAAQVNSFKKEMWGDDDTTFWANLGAVPVTDGLTFRGVPGLGSYSSLAVGLDNPTDLVGNRLSPILRPFLSSNGGTYKSYSLEDRGSHQDSIIQSLIHGTNPLEGNIQAGLNFLSQPSVQHGAPSVLGQDKSHKTNK